ncbi:MAG: SDR family NAD(P)-dependent oxidoreductase [candidate division KSB1 bacterium]
MNFTNRIVLLTGGTGALGAVIAQAFLKNGAHVTTTYHGPRSFAELQAALGEEKSRLTGISTDVTKEAGMQTLVEQTINNFGRVDVLVNLVGGYMGGVNLVDTTEVDWERMLTLNLKSTFLSCKAVLPHMLKQNYGRIVNTSSRGAVEVGPGAAAYAVSKAGVLTLTQSLAQEVKAHNITANVVLPGLIDTPQNRQGLPGADYSKWVAPASIAHLMLYLASAEAGAINGAVVPNYGKS